MKPLKANEFFALMRTAPTTSKPQSELTGDCWEVQFEGLKACETCPDRDTPQCGGGAALAQARKEVPPCQP